MENASKALIMAGGVLIAVAIITLALYAYSNYKNYASASEQMLTLSQIESFNKFYEAYTSEPINSSSYTYKIRGIDAINIYNKALDDKEKDDSLIIVQNGIDTIIGDSSRFLEEGHTVQYIYNSNGKITKVILN